MKRLFSALIIMIICLSAAQGDPLTDGGIHSFSEFTPDDENYVYYTVGGKTYGAEILPIPTPGGFSSSVSGIVTVPKDADSEKFISLWLNKNHTVSGYTVGAVMAAAESGDIMAVGNETNITLRTFVWKAGASEGVPAEDYVIDIIKGNDRTRHWFDNTYTAEGNEALELRICSNPFAEEYTPSGYSHGSFNIYSDKALPFESEWNIKPARQYSLREAKSLRDGAPVSLSEDIIATSSPANGAFFAQNRDRTQGVRMAGITAEFGEVLKNVTAVKSTLPTGETLLTVQNRTAGGSEAPLPMAMKIAALSQGIDLNDVYVRLWGKVMSKTDTSAAITDGSGTVTVDLSGASTSLRVGDFVTVTGHTYNNIIIPRRASDILVFRNARQSLRTAAPGPEVTDWSYIFTPNELIAPRGAESCLRALITAKQYVWAYINDRDWSMNGTQPEGDLVYPNQQIPYNGTAVQLYTANLYKHNVFYVYATQPFAASFFAGDATLAYTGDNHLWEYSPNFAGGGADPTDPAYTWVPATYSDAVHANDTLASYYPADIRYLGAGWYRTAFDREKSVTAAEVNDAEDGAFIALSEDLMATSDSEALSDNTFFLQNRDRTRGFRGIGADVKRGDVLRDIKAVKSTLPTGETLLTVKSFTAAGTDTVSPLGTKIGASAALTDICVRLWGKVTASDEVSATIDDGSGSAVIDLSKQVTPITHTLSVGDFVSVTGGVYDNTVMPTSDSDLVTRSGEKSDHRTAAAVAESAFSAMSRKAFSFTYDGASSDEFLSTWNRTRSVTTTEDGKVYENVFTDPATGLQLTVKATRYDISPAIEWCMYFKNTSQAKTPIIENILPLDFEAAAASAKLMTSVGNVEGGDINEYMPNISDLTSEPAVFVPGNGRSAFDVMPYFDLIFPTSGIITAVGWSGSWKASFAASEGKAVMKTGQEQCRFYLKPGEEVRTPAVITLFWSGDRDEGHNAFRRLMLNHCTPHGADIDPSASASPYLYDPNAAINVVMGGETEENMLLGINNMLTGGYVPDQWWIDAGWYKCGHWSELGNWYADPTRFPRGMKPVSNRLHENGMKLRLWVAPESAVDTSDAYTQNPQSFFYPKVEGNLGYFLNPGNPNALAWAKETMDNVITSTGCDALGFDVGPGDFRKWWNANEPADRRGINEIKHITGLYELWDYLYERHPNILLDTLGARLDFEAARRTIALWRSDYEYGWSAEGNQNCTYGMSYYLPITGGGNIRDDKYYFRSSLGSFWNSMFDYYNSSYTWQFAPVQLELFRSVQHLFRGDYYPISGGENGWMAWQFNRPDLGEGIVQIFRREVAAGNTYTVKFKGLDQSARYLVDNWDAASAMYTGKVLMNTGIRCTRTGTASGVWTYRKVK